MRHLDLYQWSVLSTLMCYMVAGLLWLLLGHQGSEIVLDTTAELVGLSACMWLALWNGGGSFVRSGLFAAAALCLLWLMYGNIHEDGAPNTLALATVLASMVSLCVFFTNEGLALHTIPMACLPVGASVLLFSEHLPPSSVFPLTLGWVSAAVGIVSILSYSANRRRRKHQQS